MRDEPKVALVTGGSRGLGRNTALHCRSNGPGSCRCSGWYRRSDRFSAVGGESLDHRTVHRSLGRDVLV